MAVILREGSILVRAKWTAKEVFIHTRAFGLRAGVRYVGERADRLRRRSQAQWEPAGPVVPAALTTTVTFGSSRVALPAGSVQLALGPGEEAVLRDVIPVVATVIFADAVPRGAQGLLRVCRDHGVRTVYLYRRPTWSARRRGHRLLISDAHAAIYYADPKEPLDLRALAVGGGR